jgi:F-type H+-transporting ATPase subunit a
MSINKAVLYLFMGSALTIIAWMYIANRMQARPNRVQTAVETLYQLMKKNITEGNMDQRMAKRWFTLIGTLFLFIWFSNLIGYIPFPTNTEHRSTSSDSGPVAVAVRGARANICDAHLTLTLMVVPLPLEGIRAAGFVPYLRGWCRGVEGAPSYRSSSRGDLALVRLICSRPDFCEHPRQPPADPVRGGGLVVLLGVAAIGVFTLPMACLLHLREWGWWRPCRHSSSPLSLHLMALSPISETVIGTVVDQDATVTHRRPGPPPTDTMPARRSHSASAPGSARSARASAWATSSAR